MRSKRSLPSRCGAAIRQSSASSATARCCWTAGRFRTARSTRQLTRCSLAAHGRDSGARRPRQDLARPGTDRQRHGPAAGRAAPRISIDLGYAPLDLGEGLRLSLVDVPGHERFVRNMVAGATGIDLFLLVVDAGEGVREQTREHAEILRLLGVSVGVVAVTKVDAVGAERVAAAVEEASDLVPGAEVVRVSATSGEGLSELRAALARAAARARPVARDLPTRLWIDRVFSLPGVGTVVTGTLWSGSIGAETSCASSRERWTGAFAPSRFTTSAWRGPLPASAWQSRSADSSGAPCAEDRRWSSPARFRSAFGWTCA